MALAPTWRSGWDSNPRAVARKLISRGIVYAMLHYNPIFLHFPDKIYFFIGRILFLGI